MFHKYKHPQQSLLTLQMKRWRRRPSLYKQSHQGGPIIPVPTVHGFTRHMSAILCNTYNTVYNIFNKHIVQYKELRSDKYLFRLCCNFFIPGKFLHL